MKRRTSGTFERCAAAGEPFDAFIPDPLPPTPPVELDGALQDRLRRAEQALARLQLAGEMVPSLDWFLYAFVRKEAVVSSQIEGTQATLVDLLAFEAEHGEGEADVDVEDVCNYLDALSYARAELASASGLPLSMRLLNEMHRRLLRGAHGAGKQPGRIRTTQNWIGGSRPGNAAYVPPPPHVLPDLLTAFERYIHSEDDLSPLVRAGLLHVQFESIHPYLDGNGRIGRLLITLLLEQWGLLTKPLLYLSLFFKRHRSEYYRRLGGVRDGDWEGWLDFFLDGVSSTADEAVASARELFAIVARDRLRVLEASHGSIAAARLFERLPRNPIVSVASVMRLLEISKPTAGRAVDALEKAGVLVELTGRKRDRSWAYEAYINQLRVGTDLTRTERDQFEAD